LHSIHKQKEYINLGSIRIARETQLSVLAELIKNRDISIDTLVDHEKPITTRDFDALKILLILLNASADLKSLKDIVSASESVEVKTHVLEALEDMMKKYLRKWEFKDTYSLHLIGKIFTLFAK